MKRRRRVYIAGPLSNGESLSTKHQERNVRVAMATGSELMDAGFAPLVPHLTLYMHEHHPHTHDEWLAVDLAWLEFANCVLRLPGASKGADMEVAVAEANGIPVYTSVKQLVEKES